MLGLILDVAMSEGTGTGSRTIQKQAEQMSLNTDTVIRFSIAVESHTHGSIARSLTAWLRPVYVADNQGWRWSFLLSWLAFGRHARVHFGPNKKKKKLLNGGANIPRATVGSWANENSRKMSKTS